MTAPSFSFTLQADPSAPLTSTASASAQAVTARPAQKRGLIRPFRRDGKGSFGRVTGDELLEQKLGNLLALSGLPWAPERTSRIDELRHVPNTQAFRAFAQVFVADAMRTYLPELSLNRIVIEGTGPAAKIIVEAVKVRDPDASIRTELKR